MAQRARLTAVLSFSHKSLYIHFVGRTKILCIVGPTSSGKSALGIWLAKKLHGEIISADSRQVYTGLNIGTGKVTKKEMQGVPHHLLDVVSPKKQFSADDFLKLGEKAIMLIQQNGHLPILVGGTGLYVDVLLGRLMLPNAPPNMPLRKRLERYSAKQLFTQLKKLDPRRAKTIEPEHKRRLIRAIEIAKAIGKNPLPKTKEKYEILWLGLSPSSEKLRRNIHRRLRVRIKAGMISEAKELHRESLSYKRMRELGLEYRFLSFLLQHKLTQAQFEIELEREINRYAKRQYRWFKHNKNIYWIKDKKEALSLAKKFISG